MERRAYTFVLDIPDWLIPFEAANPEVVLPTGAGALIRVGCLSPPPIPVFNPAPIPLIYGCYYRVGEG